MPFVIIIAIVGLIMGTQKTQVAHIEAMTKAGMCQHVEQDRKVWARCEPPAARPAGSALKHPIEVPACWFSKDPAAMLVPCAQK